METLSALPALLSPELHARRTVESHATISQVGARRMTRVFSTTLGIWDTSYT